MKHFLLERGFKPFIWYLAISFILSLLGAIQPRKCPEGYAERDGALRFTFEDTCAICPSGSYGDHPERAYCSVCQAGVVCLEGATTDQPSENASFYNGVNSTNSYPCPPGYFCPMNSSIPTPCTAGTYREYKFGESEDDCLPCPVDHFNHLTGQAGCYHCGAEAYQELTGQSACTCIGVNREFQVNIKR